MSNILTYGTYHPVIDPTAWVAPNAVVIGDVTLGPGSSVWFGCVVRGDVHEIRIGARSNIQDGSVVHCTYKRFGTYVGDDVIVGHKVVLHACTLEDRCFIGMGAVVLDGVVVERGAMVAAGALVPPGKRVPAGEVWAGNPARKLRDVRPEEIDVWVDQAARYVELAGHYRDGGSLPRIG